MTRLAACLAACLLLMACGQRAEAPAGGQAVADPVSEAPVLSSPLTPDMVGASIDAVGAKQTVTQLFVQSPAPDQLWEEFLTGVGSGESDWLALVPAISPGTDAWATESLRIVLAIALTKNPEGTLRLASERHPVEALCGNWLIEPSEAEFRALSEAQRVAVEALAAPDLADEKAQCLAVISDAMDAADSTDWNGTE